MIAERISRTGFHTFSATDTLRMIRCVYHIDIHFADTTTFLAAYAFLMIHLDLKKWYSVEQRINGPKRADPFTEWTVKQDTQDNEKHKDREFKCKKMSECRTDSWVGKWQWNRTFEYTLWANVFTEERISHTKWIGHKCRKQDHKNEQDHVF